MKKSELVMSGFIVLIVALSSAPRAGATTLARLSLEQMARAADAIVHARCISAESRWDRGAIWTFTEFDVLESLKGAPPERILVRLPGGRVGNLIANVEAVPRFQHGEEGFLFLEKMHAGDYSVTAWSEGTFRVQAAVAGGVATVTQDSGAFPVFDTGTRRFRTDGIRRIPITAFRERLQTAVATASAGATQGGIK